MVAAMLKRVLYPTVGARYNVDKKGLEMRSQVEGKGTRYDRI